MGHAEPYVKHDLNPIECFRYALLVLNVIGKMGRPNQCAANDRPEKHRFILVELPGRRGGASLQSVGSN